MIDPAEAGAARLVEVAEAALRHLGVKYRRAALKELAEQERLLATTPAPWPSHAGSVLPFARDLTKQLSALEGVLRAFGLEVDFIEAPASEVGSHGAAELLVLRTGCDGGSVALLLRRTEAGVEYRMPGGRDIAVGVAELDTLYSGILLSVRRGERTDRPPTSRARDERTLALAPVCALAAVLVFWSVAGGLHIARAGTDPGIAVLWWVLLVLDGVGLALVAALGRIDAKSAVSGLLKKACSLHSSWSCERVLSSSAARLIGPFSMVDLGGWYFASHCASLLIGATQLEMAGVLSLAFLSAATSLPYVLFSLLYQKWRVRAWCPFCVAVQLVLVSQLVALAVGLRGELAFPGAATSLLVGVSWGIAALLLLVKKQRDHSLRRREVNRLRLGQMLRNRAVFTTLLLNGTRIDARPLPTDATLSEGEGVPILACLDPQCAHCARCYEELLGWARDYPSRLAIRVRVAAQFSHLPLAEDLGRLATERNQDAVEFLRAWYRHVLQLEAAGLLRDHGGVAVDVYRSWRAARLPALGESAAPSVTTACRNWETAYQVTVWPTLFVAGYPWPSFYESGNFLPRYLVDIEQALCEPTAA